MAINIAFICGNPTTPPSGDAETYDRLGTTLGHTMNVIDGDGNPDGTDIYTAADLATDAASDNMVVLTSAVQGGSIEADIFENLAKPVMTWEGYRWPHHNFAGAGKAGETSSTYTTIDILAPSHPAVGGLSGTVTVLSTGQKLNYVKSDGLPAGATALASVPGDATRVVAWVIESGDALADGSAAPARRGGFFFTYQAGPVASSNAWTFFDAMVEWLANEANAVTMSGQHQGAGVHTASLSAVDPAATNPTVRVEMAFGGSWDAEPVAMIGTGEAGVWDRYLFQDSSDLGASELGNSSPTNTLEATNEQIGGPWPKTTAGKACARSASDGYWYDGAMFPSIDADWAIAAWTRVRNWTGDTSSNQGDPVICAQESWTSDGFRIWYDFGTGATGSSEAARIRLTNSGFTGNPVECVLETEFGIYRDTMEDADGEWLHMLAMYDHSAGQGRLIVTTKAGFQSDSGWATLGGQIVDNGRQTVMFSGWRGVANNGDWDLDLSDVVMMNTLPTDAQIAALTSVTPWADISADLRYNAGIEISRGRAHDLADTEIGQCQFTLDNLDRDFDPGYASGLHSPHVRPMTHVRVFADWEGVAYPLFRGFVSHWDPIYPMSGVDAVTRVSCFDALAIAARTNVEGGYVHEHITESSGLHFRYTERTGSWTTEIITPDATGAWIGNVTPAQSTFHTAGSKNMYPRKDTAAQGSDPGSGISIPTTIGTGSATFACWMRDNGTTVDCYPIEVREGSFANRWWHVAVETDGGIKVNWYTSGVGQVTIAATSDLMDGDWHYLVVTRTLVSGTDWDVSAYVDGVAVGTDVTGPAEGAGSSDDSQTFFYDFLGWFGEVSLLPTPLTDVAVAEVYDAWFNIFPAESTDERIARVLSNYMAIPASRLNLDAGDSVMIEEDLTGVTIAEVLRAAVVSEFGFLFVDGQGRPTFHNRSRRKSSAVALDVGDGQSIPISGIQYQTANDVQVNAAVATVSDTAASTVSAVDLDAIATYGEHKQQIALKSDDKTFAKSYVDFLVGQRAESGKRVERVGFNASGDGGSRFGRLLNLELSDLVAVTHSPPDTAGADNDITFDGWVEWLGWRILPHDWKLTARLSPKAWTVADF